MDVLALETVILAIFAVKEKDLNALLVTMVMQLDC
jgi:hypothetical protein